jgi:hypothetical protein
MQGAVSRTLRVRPSTVRPYNVGRMNGARAYGNFPLPFRSYEHTATRSEKDLDLYYAAGKGDLERVKKLIQSGLSPSVSGPDQRTPLHVAASEGHSEVCAALKILDR